MYTSYLEKISKTTATKFFFAILHRFSPTTATCYQSADFFPGMMYICVYCAFDFITLRERDRESLTVNRCGWNVPISQPFFGLWEELSKMKVFKYQPITCIKRLRRFCGIRGVQLKFG